MSRIGKKPIVIPAGVEVKIDGNVVTVKGPKGTLTDTFNPHMSYKMEGTELIVERPNDSIQMKMLHGTTRALINNMVTGVSKGFEKILEIQGIGYKAQMRGDKLVLNIGHSHEDIVDPVEGVKIEVATPTEIHVSGIDAQQVGQVAAYIRALRKPEPYHGKGIRYKGEHVLIRLSASSKKGGK